MDDYSRTRTLRGSFEDERLHLLDDFICSNVTKLRQGGCWAVKVEAVGLSIVKYTHYKGGTKANTLAAREASTSATLP